MCEDAPGSAHEVISTRGFTVSLLPTQLDTKLDAQKCLAIIGTSQDTLCIVDHYGLDRAWEMQIREILPVMVIDDLANRAHDCDILLDQNFHRNSERLYQGLVPDKCIKLLGPQYCILRSEFHNPDQKTPGEGILAFFGGSDDRSETLRFITETSESSFKYPVTVVASLFNRDIEKIKESKLPPNFRLVTNPPEMSKLMKSHRLYFGSGGTVTWERMAVGLPGIVVGVADNQVSIAMDLAASQLQVYLGDSLECDYKKSAVTIAQYYEDSNWIQKTSKLNRDLVKPFSFETLKKAYLESQNK